MFNSLWRQRAESYDSKRNSRIENYITYIVSHLDTVLTQPEQEIVAFGETDKGLYFISKGDCVLKLQDSKGRGFFSNILLEEGQHFGEISVVYDCPRTATVISRTYNTLGKLSFNRYREIVSEYPELISIIKSFI